VQQTQPLISEPLFDQVQAIRLARVASGEKPRTHTQYLKGTVACGECGQLLAFEKTRGRRGDQYEYFYCLGRQSDKNGCTFRAVQVSMVAALVEDHWATYTLPASRVAEVRRLVLEHLEEMLPNRLKEQMEAEKSLAVLSNQSAKLLQAHYADAINLEDLQREQARIATQRAMHEQTLNRQEVTETSLRDKLDKICQLLTAAHQHYLQLDDISRRDLNQAVFRRIYIHDDEVVGADLKPAFQRLLSDSLPHDLAGERKRHLPTD
jgi:site-specific DNA recombinase